MSSYLYTLLAGMIAMGLLIGGTFVLARRRRYALEMAVGGSTGKSESVPNNSPLDPDALNCMKEGIAVYGAKGAAEEDFSQEVEASPLARIANIVIQQAIEQRASQIHIEPEQGDVRIRYRVDGVLHEQMAMPKYIQAPLIARYKMMADLKPVVTPLPQRGTIRFTYESRGYQAQVTTLATRNGERLTLFLYADDDVQTDLFSLGFTAEVKERLLQLTEHPRGLILMVGPRQSGKTTTAYVLLNHLNIPARSLVTVEAFRTYTMSGVTQTLTNAREGRTFAATIAAVEQQDADVILVGEIEDAETAQAAFEAAQNHLVLATLRADTTVAALHRLRAFGLSTASLTQNLSAILVQRLARRVCPHCKEPYTFEAVGLRPFGFQPEDPVQTVELMRGAGCERCCHTGYRGRIGFYELLPMRAGLADAMNYASPLFTLEAAVRDNAFALLNQDALVKLLEGLTTVEEAQAVLEL